MSVAGILGSSFVNYAAQSVQSRMEQARKDFQQLGQDLQAGNLSRGAVRFCRDAKVRAAIHFEFTHSEQQLSFAGFSTALAGSAVRKHRGCATGLQQGAAGLSVAGAAYASSPAPWRRLNSRPAVVAVVNRKLPSC